MGLLRASNAPFSPSVLLREGGYLAPVDASATKDPLHSLIFVKSLQLGSPTGPQISRCALTTLYKCLFCYVIHASSKAIVTVARNCRLAGATLDHSLQVKWMTVLRRTFCHPGH